MTRHGLTLALPLIATLIGAAGPDPAAPAGAAAAPPATAAAPERDANFYTPEACLTRAVRNGFAPTSAATWCARHANGRSP